MKNLVIKNKKYDLPIYLPDATRAVTRALDSTDLVHEGVRGVVVNTYHLNSEPGISVLNKFGGVKKFMNFAGLVVSDSGGWQVFSLIHRNKHGGSITDLGVTFNISNSKKEIFTPQDSIKIQFEIGSDVIICLDDFTPPDATYEKAKETVERTTKWALLCKEEYLKQILERNLTETTRPHLLAVVQGGYFKELRKQSAEELMQIGFDMYGYGGYVIDDNGNLDLDISEYLANLLPSDKPKFALGLGKPRDIVNLYQMGWDIFDCTLPTRDARHKRLYTFTKDPFEGKNILDADLFSYVYISRHKYSEDTSSLSEHCDCSVCHNYSKAYLHHLFKIEDVSAYRLATLHNLRIYTKTIEALAQLTI